MDNPSPQKLPTKTYSLNREKLHYAVLYQHLDEIRTLLCQGVRADVRDNAGLTPLHYAVRNGYVDGVHALVMHDPMLLFVQSTRSTLIRTLKEKLITPYAIAMEKNNPHIIQVVRHAVNTYNHEGATPLHRSVHRGDYEAVLNLLDAGADIEARTQDNFLETALHRAMRSGNCKIVMLLLERGADIAAHNRVGYTPFGEAEQNWTTNARICLHFGLPMRSPQAVVPSIEASNTFDPTRIHEILSHPIEQAAVQSNADRLRQLLVDPTDRAVLSRALSIAAGRGWIEGTQILVSAQAGPFQAFNTVRGIIERLRRSNMNDDAHTAIFALLKNLVDQWESFKQKPADSFLDLLPPEVRSMVLRLLMNEWRASL